MSETDGTGTITRRDFIRRGSGMVAGGMGLAALGAPALVSGRNLNGKISLAFIGTGSRACEILRATADHGERIITDVCDIYPPHIEEAKKLSGNPSVRTHTEWQRVIDLKDVDAVAVAAPLFLHVPVSSAAMETGKHVFSEKSMGMDMKELNRMLAAAESHPDQVYLVGYQSRLNVALATVKELVANRSFGEITQFYVHFDRNQTWSRNDVPPEFMRILNWRLYKEYCGGLLTEVVTHEIDQVMAVLGTMPKAASFNGKIKVYKDGREHHDSIMGVWEWENDVLGAGSAHLSNGSRGSGWILLGTHGTVECYGGTLKLYWEKEARHLDSIGIAHKFTAVKLGQSLQESEKPNETPAKVLEDKVDADYDLATAREFKHFYDCILNGAKPVMDAASCRRTSIAALMAYTSSMEGGRRVTREEIEALG